MYGFHKQLPLLRLLGSENRGQRRLRGDDKPTHRTSRKAFRWCVDARFSGPCSRVREGGPQRRGLREEALKMCDVAKEQSPPFTVH